VSDPTGALTIVGRGRELRRRSPLSAGTPDEFDVAVVLGLVVC